MQTTNEPSASKKPSSKQPSSKQPSGEHCPCGSALDYSACCGLLISGKQQAQTAEQLMRSRYTAFYKRETAYIAATCWPHITDAKELAELKDSVGAVNWYGLTILEYSQGQEADSEGTVTFEAVYCEQEKPNAPQVLKEKSAFIKQQGRWHYTSGELNIRALKLSRNDPCWCGSGKKMKKCHQ